MTHEFEGHYRAKHAADFQVNATVAKRLRDKAEDGRLTCASAFAVVEETDVTPTDVGRTADLLELKITQCQLGLFGYGQGKRNIVSPAKKVPEGLGQALQNALVEGRLSCHKAWDIAKRFSLSKMEVTSACERLNIRFCSCQLGTF